MSASVCWLNGELLPAIEARISREDRGLLYGDGVFETMRAYGGILFRLHQHLERLCEGARVLRFPFELDFDGIAGACSRVLRANELQDAYVRVTVTRGAGGLPSELAASMRPTVLVSAQEFHGYPADLTERGMSVRVSATRRNTSSPLARIKSLDYLDNLLARAEAAEAGADEALLLDASGSVVEGSASNVFAVLDGTTTTPPISAGVLPGITRACVLELCQQLDLPVAESLLDLNTLRSADEAFLTNSLMEVMPLVAVNGQGVGTGVPGGITTRLQTAYRRLVSREAACE